MRKSEKEQVVFVPGLNGIRTHVSFGVMISHVTSSLSSFNLSFSLFGFMDGKLMAADKQGCGNTDTDERRNNYAAVGKKWWEPAAHYDISGMQDKHSIRFFIIDKSLI